MRLCKPRSLTDEELLELQTARHDRIRVRPEERDQFPPPIAANSCLNGGIWWTMAVLGQDKPWLIVVGGGAILWQIGEALFLLARRMLI